MIRKFMGPFPSILLLSALASGCGSQINTLRRAASSAGALGVPPAITSVTITNLSPTRGNPVVLDWGLSVGQIDRWCILENSTDVAQCVWRSDPLPTNYLDSSTDGVFSVSVYLRNSFGISEPVTSNSVLLDRTPPALAGAVVTNADPTNTNVFALTFGAVTGSTFASYCVQVNSAALSGCTWTNGALPASVTIPWGDGPKDLSIWLRDEAGNVSPRVLTNTVTLQTAVPTVAFATPAAGTAIGSAGIAAVSVTGACSENGRDVVISGSASATVQCAGGSWSAVLNFSGAADGAISIQADHSHAAGNPASPAVRAFVKDTSAPAVAISLPASGATVNVANMASFAVSGTCSENGRDVVITGDSAATVVCTAGAWSANLDFSAAAQGSVTILVNHADSAGNTAAQATRTFTKASIPPTLAITAPAGGSAVNSANQATFTVSGTCSGTGNVVVSGNASASVACTAGAWSAALDFSAAADGPVSISVDHTDGAGNAATTQTRSFAKDATAPTLAISTPAAGSFVNAANVTAFTVTGTCSESGRDVVVTGSATATVSCTAGAWSASLDLSLAAEGAVAIQANHADASGNAATQATRSFTKDTMAPTVAFNLPAANAWVTAATDSVFTFTGTCSENGQMVTLAAPVAGTATCSAGAFSLTADVSGESDGTLTFSISTVDAAGNPSGTVSRNYVKDAAAPTVAITTPAAGATMNAAASASFAVGGTCSVDENGRNIALTGAGVATTAVCNAGSWSTTIDFSAAADGAIALLADLVDEAGNPATQASRSFTKDTVAPSVALTSPNGAAVYLAGGGNVSITWTASDATSGLATNPITIEYSVDSGANWLPVAGPIAHSGSHSAVVPSLDIATARIRILAVDQVGNVGTATSSHDFAIDSTPPTLTVGGMSLNGGTPAQVSSNYVGVSIDSTDALSPITHFCFKVDDTTAPLAGDDCWTSVSAVPAPAVAAALSVSFATKPFSVFLGFAPVTTYSIYAWTRDVHGHMSALSSGGAGTMGRDKFEILYDPGTPPQVENVWATNNYTGAVVPSQGDLQIANGTQMFIRWTVTASNGLAAINPIVLHTTTDDSEYTPIVTAPLVNGANGGCSFTAPHTGCYAASTAPTGGYFRVRVTATDTNGTKGASLSSFLNVPQIRLLAGNTYRGIDSSAQSAAITPMTFLHGQTDGSSLAIASDGTMFVRDSTAIFKISPKDAILKRLVTFAGSGNASGENVDALATAVTAEKPGPIAYSPVHGLLFRDQERIRRIDLTTNVVTTLIGRPIGGSGGGDAGNTVANAHDVAVTSESTVIGPMEEKNSLHALPNGDVIFRSEASADAAHTLSTPYRIRHYHHATGQVTSIIPSGAGYSHDVNRNLSNCRLRGFGITFNPSTYALTKVLVAVEGSSSTNCGNNDGGFLSVDPVTGVSDGVHPARPANGSRAVGRRANFVVHSNGQLYMHENARIYRFSPATTEWVLIAGKADHDDYGLCANGTAITDAGCRFTVNGLAINPSGTVFVLNRNQVQAIDKTDVVRDVYFQSLFYGDGANPLSARFNSLGGIDVTNEAIPRLVLYDKTEFRIREFPVDLSDSIESIAGNGADLRAPAGSTAFGNAIEGQTNSGFGLVVNRANGDVYYSQGRQSVFRINRGTGLWERIYGGGATQMAVGDTLPGTSLTGSTYTFPIGFDGTHVIVGWEDYPDLDVFFKRYHATTLVQSQIIGVAGAKPATWPGDGQPAATSAIRSSNVALWDDLGSRLIVYSGSTGGRLLRTVTPGGTIETLSTTPLSNDGFVQNTLAYERNAGLTVHNAYYCNNNRAFRKLRMTGTPGVSTLNQPIPSLKCAGDRMIYSRQTNALYFVFSQNGLNGIAEYINPSAY